MEQTKDYIETRKVTPDKPYNAFVYVPRTIQGTVAADLEEKWGAPASAIYNWGVGLAEFAYLAALGGWGHAGAAGEAFVLGVMGSSAAADTVVAKKEQGLSDARAFTLGTIAGLIEVVTEKMGYDRLFGSEAMSRGVFHYLWSNAASEGAEEGTSDVLNLVADWVYDLVTGEQNSDFKRSVQRYRDRGYSEGEATAKAAIDFMGETAIDSFAGALSGFVMAGTNVAMSKGADAYYGRKTGKRLAGENFTQESLTQLIEDGLASPEDSAAHKLAAKMQENMNGGKTPSQTQIGRLFNAVAQGQGFVMGTKQAMDAQVETQKTAPGAGTAIKVGQATILKVPYSGETPIQGVKMERNTPYISSALVNRAQTMIANAASEAKMGRGAFKNLLTRAYEAIFKASKHVEVEGLTFQGEPYYVDINKGVPAKVISDVNHSPEKLALLEILPDIVKNGEYVGSTVGKKNAIRYDHFETAVTIHEGPYLVLFETEVYPGANNYKTHRLISMELIPQTDGVTGTPPAPSAEAPTPYAERVPQTTDGVNPEYGQTGLSATHPYQQYYSTLERTAGEMFNFQQMDAAQAMGDLLNHPYGQYAPQFIDLANQMLQDQQAAGVAQSPQFITQQLRPSVPYRSRREALAAEMTSAPWLTAKTDPAASASASESTLSQPEQGVDPDWVTSAGEISQPGGDVDGQLEVFKDEGEKEGKGKWKIETQKFGKYIREDKTLDLEGMKTAYIKFLQDVPEKCRLYLQQAVEAIECGVTDRPDIVVAYAPKDDKLMYNPDSPAIQHVNLRIALTHELGHRIDRFFVQVAKPGPFITAIQKAEAIIDVDPERFIQYCRKNDDIGYLSDILSSMSRGKYKFPAGHSEDYLQQVSHRAREVFTDIFGLEAFGEAEALRFLETYFPEVMESYRELEYGIYD